MGAVSQEEARCDGDERTGTQILKRALETPARPFATNSVANRAALENAVLVASVLLLTEAQ
jgi:chaperonin GroEL